MLTKLEPLARAIPNVHTTHPAATLTALYDPDLMLPSLCKAHHIFNCEVDGWYRLDIFTSEQECVEYLFGLYEKMSIPLEAGMREN